MGKQTTSRTTSKSSYWYSRDGIAGRERYERVCLEEEGWLEEGKGCERVGLGKRGVCEGGVGEEGVCERTGLEGVVGGREGCARVELEEERGVKGCGWRKRGVCEGEVGGREVCERVWLEEERGVKGWGWRKRRGVRELDWWSGVGEREGV